MLVDEVKIYVRSGDGGDGMIAFRREKFVPMGGPAGGDGGNGGDVIFKVNPSYNTLIYFQNNNKFKAARGGKGQSSNMHGRNAEDTEINVPAGTIIRDADTGEILADLVKPDEQFVVLKGGRGGKGNSRFTTSSNRAPRIAEKGAPGEERWLRLELKLIADVGIVGVPNAGKSTLLSVLSNAKPKIASYAFTTLEPNLGMVVYDHHGLVFADIPGLIEGAHLGIGLGHSFLRHIQRTRLVIHLLNGESDDPVADYNQINTELMLFDEKLMQKPQIVVMNKIDNPDVLEKWGRIQTDLQMRGVEVTAISALTRENIQPLIQRTFATMAQLPPEDSPINEIPVYELEVSEPIFTIERDHSGNFVVKGKRIERAAAMTYWDHEESILRFQKILEVLGISQALSAAGVEVGDTVFIGTFELEWSN